MLEDAVQASLVSVLSVLELLNHVAAGLDTYRDVLEASGFTVTIPLNSQPC